MDLVYTQTLLYIVHVDEIDVGNEKQHSSKMIRRVSKRTTASFNEREGVSTPSSFSFSNPFRRLNSNSIHRLFIEIIFTNCRFIESNRSIDTESFDTQSERYSSLESIEMISLNISVTPLCASTAKKPSFFNRSRNSHEFLPPPPPEFLHNEPQPIIRAHGPGLNDGFVDDHCSFSSFILH